MQEAQNMYNQKGQDQKNWQVIVIEHQQRGE